MEERIISGRGTHERTAVTSAQMKEIERRADEAGLSYYQMMENAGTGAAEYIASEHSAAGKTVLIFCGKGNNGGDGFVGSKAAVYALDIPSGLNGDTGEADEDAVQAGCTIAFHRLKPAHLMEKCAVFCGKTVCLSIGIDDVPGQDVLG